MKIFFYSITAISLLLFSCAKPECPMPEISQTPVFSQPMDSLPPIENLRDGLIAYYPFNGNAGDSSGNDNHGTVISASLTTDRFGNANKAYSFDGTSSYINIGNKTIIKRYNSDYTISAWVYMNSFSSTSLSDILSNRVGASDGFPIGIGSSVAILGSLGSDLGKFASLVKGGASTSIVTNTSALSTGQWYLVTVTFKYNGNNTNEVKIYLDGVLNKSGIHDDVPDPLSFPTYIGFNPGTNAPQAYHFDGKMDEVRMYGRILSESEVAQLYQLHI